MGKREMYKRNRKTVDKPPGSIFTFLKLYWRIEPRERYRAKRVLNLFKREEISRGTASELSIYTIAKKLKLAPLTIYREINRNDGLKKHRSKSMGTSGTPQNELFSKK